VQAAAIADRVVVLTWRIAQAARAEGSEWIRQEFATVYAGHVELWGTWARSGRTRAKRAAVFRRRADWVVWASVFGQRDEGAVAGAWERAKNTGCPSGWQRGTPLPGTRRYECITEHQMVAVHMAAISRSGFDRLRLNITPHVAPHAARGRIRDRGYPQGQGRVVFGVRPRCITAGRLDVRTSPMLDAEANRAGAGGAGEQARRPDEGPLSLRERFTATRGPGTTRCRRRSVPRYDRPRNVTIVRARAARPVECWQAEW